MSPDEAEAWREINHIANGDMVTMFIDSEGVVNTLRYLYFAHYRNCRWFSGRQPR